VYGAASTDTNTGTVLLLGRNLARLRGNVDVEAAALVNHDDND